MTAAARRNPRQTKALARLSEESAELLARRINKVEGLIKTLTLEEWAEMCLVLCPELYAEPEHDAFWPTEEAPGSPGKSALLYQRSLCQCSLWHDQDPTDFPGLADLIVPLFANKEQRKEWRRLKASRREPRRRKPKPAPAGRHWHQGMIWFDEDDGPAGREYDPCEWKRKGDESEDGEVNAKRRRVAR